MVWIPIIQKSKLSKNLKTFMIIQNYLRTWWKQIEKWPMSRNGTPKRPIKERPSISQSILSKTFKMSRLLTLRFWSSEKIQITFSFFLTSSHSFTISKNRWWKQENQSRILIWSTMFLLQPWKQTRLILPTSGSSLHILRWFRHQQFISSMPF